MASKKKNSGVMESLSADLEAVSELEQTDQTWVLQTAASRLGVTGPTGGPDQRGGTGAPIPSQGQGNQRGQQTPRQFLRSKSPTTDVQRAVCLAYYLTHFRNQPHFKALDLGGLHTEAAGPAMNLSRAANNATNQNRYLAAAGSGNKQITALGEDVVDALPDQDAVSRVGQQAPVRRKKSTNKKTKK